VHCAFAGVFTDDSVNYDCFFAIVTSYVRLSVIDLHPITYRGENHPFLPLNQLAVFVGAAGINPNARMPSTSVKSPCYIVNISYL
jgi:hypothetical protein